MTTRHPYLIINGEAQLEWVMGANAATKGVHQLTPFFKGDVGLDTGEVVVDFVRYNRNYFAFYTSMGKTYEYGNSELVEIALPSELTPCYHAGWYIGFGDSRLMFVNRKKPDVYLSYFTTQPIQTVVRLPYTDTLLLDDGTSWARYKLDIDEDNKAIDLSDKKTICETGLLAMDEDGCCITVSHSGGKITVVWTTSWKTHHTLRAPDMLTMVVCKTCLVGITADRNHVYYWDLSSGDVELVLSSSWHRPLYIAWHEDIPGCGITTIDPDGKTLAMWEMNGPTTRWKKWEPFKISNRVQLVSVVPFNWQISAVAFWSNKILLNADGLMLKLQGNLNGRSFTWPTQLASWIEDPSVDLYLEPLLEADNSLPSIIRDACILNMGHIMARILENVMTGSRKSWRWSLHKILKDQGIADAFNLALEFSIVKMYSDELFKDREMCTQLAMWCRTMGLDISNLFEILPLPTTTSDFIFYLTMVSTLTQVYEQRIAARPGLLEKTWEYFKGGSMTARQLLYKLHMYITKWNEYLEDVRCFEFVLPPVVYHSCKSGYTNEWIALFRKIERTKPNRNVKACWDELVRYVCNKDILRTHEYPNPNDGKWVKREISDIPMHSWILIDDVVQQIKHSDEELEGEVQCWVPNSEGCNAIERALTLLDLDLWQHNPEWKTVEDNTLRDLCTGTELRLGTGVGHLIEWPILVMEAGVICSVKPEQKVEYRLPSLELSVPLSVRMEVEDYLKKEIASGSLPRIPDRFKPVVFDMLSPTPIMSITPINIDDDKEGTPVTAVCCAGRFNVWFGTFNGHIIIIPTDSLTKQPLERKTIMTFDTFDDSITGLTYRAMKVAGVSAAGHIKIWDCKTYERVAILEDKGAQAARFVSMDTLWYVSVKGLYSWNFVLDTDPMVIWSSPASAPTLTHYSLDSYEQYATCSSSRETHWHTPSPPSQSHKAPGCGSQPICMISEQDFIVGDSKGKVHIVSSMEADFEDEVWQHPYDSPITALCNIEESVRYTLAIGCEDGTFVLQPLSETDTCPPLFEWKASEAVIHIAYSKPRMILVTADYCVYMLVYADQQLTLASKAIVQLSKQPDWKKFLQRPVHSPTIQEIVAAGVIRGRELDHFWKVFDVVLENEDALRTWCVPEVLDTLDICRKKSSVPVRYNKVAKRLFCYSGKRFTCVLCLGSSSSPKRFPISALKTCMHRFHTKCIAEHISKTREWNEECRHNWALNVNLTCPTCREPYNRSDVVDDKFTADLCKYISDDEESEL